MIGIQRISVLPIGKSEVAILLTIDGQEHKVLYSELAQLDTEAKVQAAIDLKIKDIEDLPPIFLHRNRNGSYAVATGAAPEVWPEDEPPKKSAEEIDAEFEARNK